MKIWKIEFHFVQISVAAGSSGKKNIDQNVAALIDFQNLEITVFLKVVQAYNTYVGRAF